MAPADVPKHGSSFDVAIAAAIMLAASQVTHHFTSSEALSGKLGFDELVRPVRAIIAKILAGRAKGVKTIFIPEPTLQQSQLIPHDVLIPVPGLAVSYRCVCRISPVKINNNGEGIFEPTDDNAHNPASREPVSLNYFVGQARAKDTSEYPANFIFVATANPCPCGYYGTQKLCQCAPPQVQRYQQKVSGPILDRIDLYSEVNEVDHSKLLTNHSVIDDHALPKIRIQKARDFQPKRYINRQKLNKDMSNTDIKRPAQLSREAKELLDVMSKRLELSARANMRSIKVARTIADHENSQTITPAHIGEALQYRSQQKSIM